jgi:hypothetical protein
MFQYIPISFIDITHATIFNIKLANELFDFSNTHWVAAVRNAQASFDKELAFYELFKLDLDAEGDDDVYVDNTTEQVLGFEYLYVQYNCMEF